MDELPKPSTEEAVALRSESAISVRESGVGVALGGGAESADPDGVGVMPGVRRGRGRSSWGRSPGAGDEVRRLNGQHADDQEAAGDARDQVVADATPGLSCVELLPRLIQTRTLSRLASFAILATGRHGTSLTPGRCPGPPRSAEQPPMQYLTLWRMHVAAQRCAKAVPAWRSWFCNWLRIRSGVQSCIQTPVRRVARHVAQAGGLKTGELLLLVKREAAGVCAIPARARPCS